MFDMELKHRRILALSFLFIFFIIAPLTVLYANGFRINLKPLQITKTGSISLFGEPKNVLIEINDDEPDSFNLPKSFRYLLPGNYKINISANQYLDWPIEVNVKAGESSNLSNIQLIKDNPISTLMTGLPNNAKLSPSGEWIAWILDEKIQVSSENKKNESQKVKGLASIVWANDGQAVIGFNATNQPLAKFSIEAKFEMIPQQTQKFEFLGANLNFLLAKEKNNYFIFQDSIWTLLPLTDILEIKITNDNILVLNIDDQNQNTLSWYNPTLKLQRKINLPATNGAELLSENNHIWILDNSQNRSLLLVPEFSNYKILEFPFRFEHIQNIPNTKDLFVYNQNSAWLINEHGDYSIVSRWSESVIKPILLGNQTLAIIGNNEILLRNLQYNKSFTFKVKDLESADFANKNGIFYFTAKDGDLRSWQKAEFF
ncbi:MAG: hypothetical protein WCT08_01785 [Patescibacteria group bacterium]|jgi:hypothetical protein